jgi:hypothetical protein
MFFKVYPFHQKMLAATCLPTASFSPLISYMFLTDEAPISENEEFIAFSLFPVLWAVY